MVPTDDTPEDVTPDAGEPGDAGEATARPRSGGALRRIVILTFLLLLVLAGLYYGAPYYRHAISHESTDDAFVEGHVVPISARVAGRVATVHVADNQWVEEGDLLAELDPRKFQAKLASAQAALRVARAAHKAKTITVDLTKITSPAGAKEASANVKTARATIATAKAKVAAARSLHDQAHAKLAATQAERAQARAELGVSEAKYQRERADLARYREMASKQIITRQQLDHAAANERMAAADLDAAKRKVDTQRASVRQAQAALKAADDNLRETRSHVSARNAELDESKARLSAAGAVPQQVAYSQSQADISKARIAQAEADVTRAQLDLADTNIASPGSGYVTRKTVEPGAYVQVGRSLMAIVMPKVWVVANFKETQLTRMRIGQPVDINVDTYPNVVFRGRVDSIQRGTGARFSLLPPENATGNYVKVVQRVPVKIVFNDQRRVRKYLLVPGMSVVPEVDISVNGQLAPPRATTRGPINPTQPRKPSR